VSDRISLQVTGEQEVINAVQAHLELIKGETLSLELQANLGDAAGSTIVVGNDLPVKVVVTKL